MRRHRYTGWGLGQRLSSGVIIFNFDVDSAQLKLEHLDMLRSWVVPLLNKRYSISIVGLASRTGKTAHNLHLSQQRADRTLEFLSGEVRNNFNAKNVIGYGDLMAEDAGDRENTEDPRFRAVLILAAPGPTPPAPPPKIDLSSVQVDGRLPKPDRWDQAGLVVDRVVDVAGFLEQVSWGEVAEAFGKIGIVFQVISSTIGMPVLWHGVREQNLTNGGMQGFWEAMQDMSNAFSDPSIPPAKWPPIPVPVPRSFGIPDSFLPLNEREWMEGRTEGCRAAYQTVTKAEVEPLMIKKKSYTGRQFLAALAQSYGSNVGEEFHREFDRRLLKKCGKTWPLSG